MRSHALNSPPPSLWLLFVVLPVLSGRDKVMVVEDGGSMSLFATPVAPELLKRLSISTTRFLVFQEAADTLVCRVSLYIPHFFPACPKNFTSLSLSLRPFSVLILSYISSITFQWRRLYQPAPRWFFTQRCVRHTHYSWLEMLPGCIHQQRKEKQLLQRVACPFSWLELPLPFWIAFGLPCKECSHTTLMAMDGIICQRNF